MLWMGFEFFTEGFNSIGDMYKLVSILNLLMGMFL